MHGSALERSTVEPRSVVLFSGHMIDKPGRLPPRFPEAKAEEAGRRIAAELDSLGVASGDLGISQAACGGDLLFARACLERGLRLWIMLPQKESKFLAASVCFADPRWRRYYDAVRADEDAEFRLMPEELGSTPEGMDIYARCNGWLMHTALSCGGTRVSFLALWDGRVGDGPGGTEHMVELMRRQTGRRPTIIDPAML
jgi:hypothetical protein